MSSKRRYWVAISLAALSASGGCSTMGSLWPSGGWWGSKSTPSSSLAQQSKSKAGANAQLGAPAAAAGTMAGLTAPLRSWTSGQGHAPANDPLHMDNTPKQLTTELSVQVARMHEAKGDYPAAIKHYEEALASAPNNTEVLVGLGRAYDRQGNMHKAIETYQRALKVDPKCALAHNDLGLCFARQRDFERSRHSLQQAVSLVPGSKLYRNNLATVMVEQRQYDAALEQLAAVNAPAVAQYNLGILASRSGDKNEAIKRLQLASAADPNLHQARTMIDRINGVVAEAPLPTPSVTDLRAQASAFHNQMRGQAQQYQAQATDHARHYQAQAEQSVQQTRTQLHEARNQMVSQAQTQASDGVARTSESAQSAVREAEAKIRASLPSYVTPVAPGYESSWVPPPSDDITPIAPEDVPPTNSDEYVGEEPSDESPVLLPPIQ